VIVGADGSAERGKPPACARRGAAPRGPVADRLRLEARDMSGPLRGYGDMGSFGSHPSPESTPAVYSGRQRNCSTRRSARLPEESTTSRSSARSSRTPAANEMVKGERMSERSFLPPSPFRTVRHPGHPQGPCSMIARLISWMALVTRMPRGQHSVQLKIVRHRNAPVLSERISSRSAAP
jgi:hypothetical protein